MAHLATQTLGLLGATLLVCASGWLGVELLASPGHWQSLVWAPSGVALTLLSWRGREALLPLTLGALALMLSQRAHGTQNVAEVLTLAGSVALAPLWPALVLTRVEFRSSMARLGDILLLTVVGALGTGLGVAVLYTLGHLWTFGGLPHGLGWAVRAMAAALGVLMVAPVVLVWGHSVRAGQVVWLEAVEVACLCVTITMVATHLWQPTGPELALGQTRVPLLVLPALLWASTRFGQRGAVTSLGVLALWSLLTGRSAGVLAQPLGDIDLLAAQLSLGAAALCVLIFGAMIEERRQAIRVRDDFLIIASHELKTPLTALMLGVENLERRLQREYDPKNLVHIRKLGMCHQQVNRLAKLVDGLLDVSRISNRRLHLQRQPADLAGIVRIAVGEVRSQAEQLHCPLDVQLTEGTWGQWDCSRMTQLVRALLDNACKYGAGHPVTIRLTTTAVGARLIITDSGIGIAPADLCRIFGRFERAVSAQYYGGMGLGLYVARKIARAHGGDLFVRSTVGAGSAFTVELPRRQGLMRRLLGLRRREPRMNEGAPLMP